MKDLFELWSKVFGQKGFTKLPPVEHLAPMPKVKLPAKHSKADRIESLERELADIKELLVRQIELTEALARSHSELARDLTPYLPEK